MADTIFRKDDIVEGEYDGKPYKFRALKGGVEGSGSVYGPGIDLIKNQKVFLKKYVDPAPRSPWFNAFVEYQNKIQDNIAKSRNARQLIAGIHLYFQDGRRRFWQAIEYVENSRDLKEYLESSATTWEQRMVFAKVFMFAMKVLHQEVHLVHGDLKPANLLLVPQGNNNFSIKLIDFDRPILLDEENIPWAQDAGYIGSPGYYSPEHQKRERPAEKSDIFTCGLILYELLTKEGHPFNFASVTADYNTNNAPIPHLLGSFGNEHLDNDVANMLHRMLEPNPNDRPTADEVHQILLCRSGAVNSAESVAHQTTESARVSDPFGNMSVQPQTRQEPQKGAADIVFLIDATNSMRPCIDALKSHIHTFIEALVCGDEEKGIAPVEDWRARVVGYRDFLDCNKNGKIAKTYQKFGKGGWFLSKPFTKNEDELHDQLNSLKPFGGGKDPKESLLDALMLVLKSGYLPVNQQNDENTAEGIAWRKKGVGRIVIVFTDAGYHSVMSYASQNTHFEEGLAYPLNLKGAGLDELQNAIESGFFKIYVFAPSISDYDELSDLSNVMIMQSDDEEGGLSNIVDDNHIARLIEDIIRGVSRSSSDYREIPL